MFANWGPPSRVLVEHFSEWFSAFFLVYRHLRWKALNTQPAFRLARERASSSKEPLIPLGHEAVDIVFLLRVPFFGMGFTYFPVTVF